MSDIITIQATKRERTGKGNARTLRRAEKIPAVVYGHGYEPVSITLDGNVLNKMFKPGNEDAAEYQLFQLQIESEGALIENQVMVKQIQRHPLQQTIEHVDFFAIKMDEPIVAPVHIRLHGKSEGVKLGGILRHILREIEVKSLPADVPSHIDLDIEHMQIGDSIHVSDLQVSEKVHILTDPAAAIVNIMAPVAEKGPAEGEQAGAAAGVAAPAEKK
jgi:large subunit ribosomal protein L25